ncbi:hypothetical protein LJ656_25345 [Paraburkholderia sp. MMS20-SJTR3]|uniref:Transmembrane protein n=1 Tax=Paraburkholderia sejongensis TaxID=2886946 RepID=A0ABS8K184_9BURK|nr:hypothetical protein [Paraburkholderia sp. MMS20-SJTR3]MCC8395914.1 hypothetical protein [Paraburkholderia sp. MMS20-SJTR3]
MPRDTTIIRRALFRRKNLSFVAWVAIGTGSVFLAVSLPLPAFGAFAVGACCAYAGRYARRRDMQPPLLGHDPQVASAVDATNEELPSVDTAAPSAAATAPAPAETPQQPENTEQTKNGTPVR